MAGKSSIKEEFQKSAATLNLLPERNADGSFNLENAFKNTTDILRQFEYTLSSNRLALIEGTESITINLPRIATSAIEQDALFDELTQVYQFLNVALSCRVSKTKLDLSIQEKDGYFVPQVHIDPSQDWYHSNVAWQTCCGRSCCKLGEEKRAQKLKNPKQ